MADLPAMPWPRWEILCTMPDDDGVKVALVPAGDGFRQTSADTSAMCCAPHVDIAGRTLDSTGHEASYDG